MKTGFIRWAASLAVLGVLGVAAAALVAAQTAVVDKRTYVWRAELVSVDATAKTVTAKAPVETAVTRYVASRFKTGDKVMLTWAANAGKPDTGPVFYIETQEIMKASKVDAGYILPVEFVSADTAGKTVTFKATVPDSALQALKAIAPGQWIQVTAPMSQPAATAAIVSVASSSKPEAFVRDEPVNPLAAEPVAMVATVEDYDRAMKAIGTAFGATSKAIQSSAMADAKKQLGPVLATMMAVQTFWVEKKKDDVAAIAKDSVTKFQALDKAIDARDTNAVAAALKDAGGTCGACHAKYREQNPETKAYAIKAGTL